MIFPPKSYREILQQPSKFYLPSPLLFLARVYHPLDPIRVGGEPERPVKPDNSRLRVQRDVTDAGSSEVGDEPFHDGAAEPEALERGVHHDVPHDGIKDSVPRSAGERYRRPAVAAVVGEPDDGLGMFESEADARGLAARESDAGEDVVERVEVEAVGGAAEGEAARLELLVGESEGSSTCGGCTVAGGGGGGGEAGGGGL